SQLVIQLNEGMTRESLTDDYLKKIEVDGQQKYKDIQVQARSFLDTDDEATGGPTRWEVRIPQPAGEALDGEAALRRLDEIEADVRAILAGKLVPEGYNLAVTSPKAVDFEVQLKLLRPADMTKERESENWLNFVTQGEFHTEDDGIDKWFTFTGTKAFEHHLDGVSQVVTFASRDINAGTPQEVENNWKTFYDVIAAKFAKFPKAKEIIEGGFPAFRTFDEVMRTGRRDLKDDGLYGYARRADIKATISLLRPLAIETFRAEFAKQQQLSTNDWVKFLGPEQIVAAEGSSDPNNASIYVINGTNVFMFDFDEVLKSRTNDVDVALETLIAKLDDSLRENPEIETGVTAPIPRSSVIGGRIAGETQARALLALLIALIAIVIYIGIRFKSAGWGYAAVAALVHDTMFTLGAIAVIDYTFGHQLGFDLKIDLNAIAALLTVIGYSLNDTIVIFDRIREIRGKNPDLTTKMVNDSINQTLSRTLLTTITTLIVVVILYFLGGQSVRAFSFCLLVGIIAGTYSTVFIASPCLLWMMGTSKSKPAKTDKSKAMA
ncbi:MAG: protein translocase subunit SecF, partial [Planctomycetes bacterium]|nr:protein translocase subunit SecF [Planctomycetota bacterium]